MSKLQDRYAKEMREYGAPLGEAQRRLCDYVRKVRFKRALFGVSERDVWRKLAEINELFQQALVAERARYEALLEAQQSMTDKLSKDSGSGGETAIE